MSQTDYETLLRSEEGKRLLRQEQLLVDAQEEIASAMARVGFSKADLAEALGKSRAFVTQVLGNDRNLTLRTWADIATALGHRVFPRMSEDSPCSKPETATLEAEWTFEGTKRLGIARIAAEGSSTAGGQP